MALYSKYRPKHFEDVIGQEHIITTLEQATLQKKLSHAYLFAGPRGTGKTSVARILARLIMTENVTDDGIKKHIVSGIDDGNIVDLIELDAASNRRIDDMRSLLESIQFTPSIAPAKVYIIDEAHMLTKEAFNALLKTLEEPPSYAYFILATTELHKIPATIQSRCQRFLFRQMKDAQVIDALVAIAKKEGITMEHSAAACIAEHAHGGMRDAISILDQLRSLTRVTAADVKERIGETGSEFVPEILKAMDGCDERMMLDIVSRCEMNGIATEHLLRLLLRELRSLLHEQIRAGDKRSKRSIERIEVILGALKDIRMSPSPTVCLETALLSLVADCKDSAIHDAKQVAEPQKATPPPPEDKMPSKQPNQVPEEKKEEQEAVAITGELRLDDLRNAWQSIVEKIQPASVKMSLKNGRVVRIDGQSIIVSFMSAFHRDRVADVDASRSIEEVIRTITGANGKIECVLETDLQPAMKKQEDIVDLAALAAEVF